MPPGNRLSGLAQGFGQAAGNFSRALASVMQHRQARAERDRQRERENLMDRLELAATPGVSVGSPEELPMMSGPSSEAPSGGRFTEALMGGVRGFDPERSSGRVSVADADSPGGTFSEGLARTIAGTERPEVSSSTATRMGELGGAPVFFDQRAARRATMEEPEPNLPEWREEGFSSREEYLEFLRDKQRATTLPEPESGEAAPDGPPMNPSDSQLAQVGVPERTRQALRGAPADLRYETFSRYSTGLEDSNTDERPRPSFGQASGLVDRMFRTGSEIGPTGESEPTYSLGPAQRAAKADSLAAGDLTVTELAKRRQRGGSPQTAGTDLAEPPRDKVQQVVQAAGGIEPAISRLEGLESRDRAQEAMLQHLRRLQKTGNTRGQ